MSEDEDMNEYPDFVQIGKNSPSHESLPSRENSVILEARDLKKSVVGSETEKSLYVMPLQHQSNGNTSPYNSPPAHGVTQSYPANGHDTGVCQIQILEEPEEKFRFRYKSEMQGTHGCIHGKNFTKKSKKFPEVQIVNVPQDVKVVRLRVALYTNEKPRKHHVHKIMWKQFSDREQDFIEVDVPKKNGFKHNWQGLGIIHTSRRFIDETIFNRIQKVFLEQKGAKMRDPYPRLSDAEELQLKSDAARMGKEITDKLNTVVLGFEAFRVENGIYYPLCSMAFTNAINNLKNPSTGDLKICRISAYTGSVTGGDEIFIFIERVKKGDISVRFFQLDENDERGWEADAHFTEGDVHHQYAIAFKTPPYEIQTVTEDVNVFFELYRPSDNAYSEPKHFRYKPREEIRLGKRARMSSSFAVRSQPLPNAPVSHRPQDSAEPSINLGNLINDLLKNEDYVETLGEPTPYDTVIHCHSSVTSEVVPDLLQFSRPLLDLSVPVITVGHAHIPTIAADSVSSRRTPTPASASSRELTSEMLRTMTKAMSNLTTNCKTEESRQHLKESIMNIENNEGNNIIHIAVLNKEVEALQMIINMLKNVGLEDVADFQNKSLKTPLHLAAEDELTEAITMLLGLNASVNIPDKDGDTPVHIAVRNGSVNTLTSLFGSDADPNFPNNFGKFPLHLAVERNLAEAVRVLLEAGVDVDAQEQVSGKTALHLAVERGLEDMVTILVREAQVDIARTDFSGLTALELAETGRSLAVKKTLIKEIKRKF